MDCSSMDLALGSDFGHQSCYQMRCFENLAVDSRPRSFVAIVQGTPSTVHAS